VTDVPYDKNSWGTPQHIIEAVREAFGGQIDCDPASNAKAQERVRAEVWYGEDTPFSGALSNDGCDFFWLGRVWLNPPYGKGLILPFADQLREEIDAARCAAHAVLVNLDPSTEWFKTFESCSTHLVNLGRVAFLHPDTGLPVKGNSRAQCLLVRNVNLEPLRKLGSVYAKV
jgi:phage N-6-adenine-methyltransferase